MDGGEMDYDRYVRQVGNLLLSIAEKSIGSGVDAANDADTADPQALFLVELADGGAISVSEVAANLKIKPNIKTLFKGRFHNRDAAVRRRNRQGGRDRKAAAAARGEKVAREISRSYLDVIGRALRGASSRERENFLTMLVIIDESFRMEVDRRSSQPG